MPYNQPSVWSSNHKHMEVLPVHYTLIIKATLYRTEKLMPIPFFIVDVKYEVMISHAASTQWSLLKVLCNNNIK